MASIIYVWMAELCSLSVRGLDVFLADIIVNLYFMPSEFDDLQSVYHHCSLHKKPAENSCLKLTPRIS